MEYEAKYILVLINIFTILYILLLRKTVKNSNITIKNEKERVRLLEYHSEGIRNIIERLDNTTDKKIQELIFVSRLDTQAHQALSIMKNFFMDKDKAYVWWNAPNSLLGGIAPNDLYKSGRSLKLLKFVRNMLSENQ